SYPCRVRKGTLTARAYKKELIHERHRHRFEVNDIYRPTLEEHGMVISGVCPTNKLIEIIELANHPWFIAGQFHPELRSRATNAHPLFRDFVKAAMEYREHHNHLD